MTAVMRAMSVAAGAKVLRIGVVRAGRVVEERIVKQRSTITVGASESATFVITAPLPSGAFPLFERAGSGYHLNLLDGMTGRLALATGITELRGVTGTKLLLGEESRGKVVVGDTTFLFQFVAPPPPQARPQLPLAVKGNLGSHDWTLTFVAAFSFLLHFGLVGTMYSDWADPIVDDGHQVAGLVDMMSRIPPPPVVETPEKIVDNSAPVKVPTLPTKDPAPKVYPGPNNAPTQSSPRNNSTISDSRAARLAAEAEAMQIRDLASVVGGPAVTRAMERSDVPGVDLTRAAESAAGVATNTGDLHPSSSGGPVQAKKGTDLSTLGVHKAEARGEPGHETATAGPTGIAQVGVPVTSIPVPGADATVAGLRGRFRSCYQTGLLSDSTMAGKVVISARIGPNGEVASSDIASISGLSPSVGQCIAGVVKRATFSATGNGGATLQIPVTFVQQAAK